MTKYADAIVLGKPTSAEASTTVSFASGSAEMTPLSLRFDSVVASATSLTAGTENPILIRMWMQRDGNTMDGPLKDGSGAFRSGLWFLGRVSGESRRVLMVNGFFWPLTAENYQNAIGQTVSLQQVVDSWTTSRQPGHSCETEPPNKAP